MALTIEQEQALLALLNEKKITLSELPKATVINEDNLMLIRQGILDKSVSSSVMKNHFTPPAASLTESGITRLSNAINSDDESIAATSKAVKFVYDLANSKLSILPEASESTSGIIQLNDTTNSASITQAATANAVKKTYDFANTKVKSVNGKSGSDITLSASDVDCVSATEGGVFHNPITAVGLGPYGYAHQYLTTAPFFSEFITSGTSEYHPVIKQKATIDGVASYAMSMGTIISNGTHAWNLNFKGSGASTITFTWNMNGDFIAPGKITGSSLNSNTHVYAGGGQAYLRNDGHIYGPVWGGYISEWIAKSYVASIRRGSQQYIKPDDWFLRYEVPNGYITGIHNETKDGNIRFSGFYYRTPMYSIAGTWVNSANS